MTRRQPEIGSALGFTTDEVVRRADARLDYLEAIRRHLISELVTATESLSAGTPPIDVVIRLHNTTGRMLTGEPMAHSKAA